MSKFRPWDEKIPQEDWETFWATVIEVTENVLGVDEEGDPRFLLELRDLRKHSHYIRVPNHGYLMDLSTEDKLREISRLSNDAEYLMSRVRSLAHIVEEEVHE